MSEQRYSVDPDDPRAPSQAVWDALSPAARAVVLASLPSEIPLAYPPEGDQHFVPKVRAREALEDWFRRQGRSVYIASELPVYYPDERMFAPDLIAVLDVSTHERDRWVVSAEERGIDFALEILVRGDRKKDLERNVERLARLGVPEYFIYEPVRRRITGHRLAMPDARVYTPIVPQAGRWTSKVLGLDLSLEQNRLRFLVGGVAPLPDARELIEKLSALVDASAQRAEEEARRAEEEARRAEEEARRAEGEARRAEEEARRAEEEARRAEEEARRAEGEARRAEGEAQRAHAAIERAERLAAKLRELGVDPDEIE